MTANDWLDKGVRKGLYLNGISAERELVEELCSQARARLGNDTDTKLAYGYGMSAARDYAREREVPVSKMELSAYGDETNDYEKSFSTNVLPWDRLNPCGDHTDPQIEQIVSQAEDDDRRQALKELQEESPKDYKFLMDYENTSHHTETERYRARNIRLWLHRRCNSVGRLRVPHRKCKRALKETETTVSMPKVKVKLPNGRGFYEYSI